MKIEEAAEQLVTMLREKGLTLVTAESCTGGGVGHAVTAVPGSSNVYLGGVVSYANAVKQDLLDVPEIVLKTHGAVSEQTADFMARNARKLLKADIAVSITGIAGPASDDTKKPVGLVYIGVSMKNSAAVKECHFSGDRQSVRDQSILAAISMVLETISR